MYYKGFANGSALADLYYHRSGAEKVHVNATNVDCDSDINPLEAIQITAMVQVMDTPLNLTDCQGDEFQHGQ